MKYDFDRVIERIGTDCTKWQFYSTPDGVLEWPEEGGCRGTDGILPLWVADMDFQSPQPVVDALVNRALHGVYGYTSRTKAYNDSVAHWMRQQNGWEIQPEWIITTPGVVNALHTTVQAFTKPGEKVLIQPPVYHPFTHAVERNNRVVVHNTLQLRGSRYEIDFDDLDEKTRDPAVKLAFLCSPHNPVGRVWTQEELRRFGEICNANDVIVVADEVHSDLLLGDAEFTTYAALGEEFAQNTIVTTSPSKTFNLPGLKTSNIIIPNSEIRDVFAQQLLSNGLYGLNAFGSTAIQAAYYHGKDWLDQVLIYIEENLQFMCEYLEKHLPQAVVIPPEGTYLVWVDLRPFGYEPEVLKTRLLEEGRILLDDGGIFGEAGEGFSRFNIACPRSILAEALERMHRVLSQ